MFGKDTVTAACHCRLTGSIVPGLLLLQKLLALTLAGSETPVVVGNTMCLMSRLLLVNPAAFQDLLVSSAVAGALPASYTLRPHDAPTERLLGCLLELWTEHFDSVAQPLARKLCAAGLAACLRLRSPVVLTYVGTILSHVTGVWRELEAPTRTSNAEEWLYGQGVFGLSSSDEDGMGGLAVAQSAEATGESRRQAALQEHEPLRHLQLSSWLQAALLEAAASQQQEYAAAMVSLHPAIRAELDAMLLQSGAQQQ